MMFVERDLQFELQMCHKKMAKTGTLFGVQVPIVQCENVKKSRKSLSTLPFLMTIKS